MPSTRDQNPKQDLHNVAVIIHFASGDFNQGFDVNLRINNDGRCHYQRRNNRLPPAPELLHVYQEWARKYDAMGLNWAKVTPVDGAKTHEANFDGCLTAADIVQKHLNSWFKSDGFELLSARIQQNDLVQRDRSVPVIFDFDTKNLEINEQLRKIPWHQWQLFRELVQAEVAISLGPRLSSPKINSPVRVLAVFGSDQGGLSLQKDQESLQRILQPAGAEIEFSTQPTAEELNNHLYNPKGWDILFFTGHSNSDLNDGHLLLSENHSVSLNIFEDAFRFAIQRERGLKLAIFNSCTGLGIANFFAGWNGNDKFPGQSLPNIIVMREQIPDFVARRFFREFLNQFTSGEPIYRAVREARNRLTFLDGERVDQDQKKQPYPCASWIPVVCLNPNQPETSWPPSPKPPMPSNKPRSGSIWRWIGAVGGGIFEIPKRKKIYTFFSVLTLGTFFLVALWLTGRPTPINVPTREGEEYYYDLLELSLEETSSEGAFTLKKVEIEGPQIHELTEMNNGKVDIVWMMTSYEREFFATPVPIPLTQGLLSYRLCLINKDNPNIFSEIKDRTDFIDNEYSIGQVTDWPDTRILREDGFEVEAYETKPYIVRELEEGEIDCFARGTNEIWGELESYNNLTVDKNIFFQYYSPVYFFASPNNKKLADRIKRGLDSALKNGKFCELLMKHYGEAIREAKLIERQEIKVKNHSLLPEAHSKYFLPFHDPAHPASRGECSQQ